MFDAKYARIYTTIMHPMRWGVSPMWWTVRKEMSLITMSKDQQIGFRKQLQHGSEKIMNNIEKKKHKELVNILSELIETIVLMKEEEKDYLLTQNEDEARDWLEFLKKHTDKDELKSLEKEISDRFFFRYDVKIGKSELDNKRAELMKRYILKSNEYLK